MSDNAGSAPLPVKILLGVAVFLLAIAAVMAVFEVRWLKKATHTTATIVEIRREQMTGVSSRPQNPGYRVIFQFVADDGRVATVPSKVVSSFTSYRVGDQAPIDYQPGHPSGAQLVRWADRWLFATVVFFLGAVALFIGGVALAITRRVGSLVIRS